MISSIELLAGASLTQMIQPQATYDVQKTADDDGGETISITLAAPDLQAEGLHLQTWGSSYLLANRLHRIPVTIPRDSPAAWPILELGTGTGLVGLSAAALWRRTAMLTDFASIVPGTAANVARNRPLLDAHGAAACCGSLDWNAPATLVVAPDDATGAAVMAGGGGGGATRRRRAHVIVTADTLYTSEQPALLVGCIQTWLVRDAEARVIVCYPMRVHALDAIREFWDRMERAGFEAVQEQQERIEGEDWDDEKLHEWAVFRWRHIPTDGAE